MHSMERHYIWVVSFRIFKEETQVIVIAFSLHYQPIMSIFPFTCHGPGAMWLDYMYYPCVSAKAEPSNR